MPVHRSGKRQIAFILGGVAVFLKLRDTISSIRYWDGVNPAREPLALDNEKFSMWLGEITPELFRRIVAFRRLGRDFDAELLFDDVRDRGWPLPSSALHDDEALNYLWQKSRASAYLMVSSSPTYQPHQTDCSHSTNNILTRNARISAGASLCRHAASGTNDVRRGLVHYNWMQGLKAHINSSHVGVLHSGFIKRGMIDTHSRDLTMVDTAPDFEMDVTSYGLRGGAFDSLEDGATLIEGTAALQTFQ